MGTFTTKIKLGECGFVVRGHLEYYVQEMEVGKVTIEQLHPKHASNGNPVYIEKYMCVDTGIGSGSFYYYGKDIFSTRKDAEEIGVVKYKQRAHKQIAKRDAYLAKQQEHQRIMELRQLEVLKAKYEGKGE
jgi:hypothetical protein